MFRVLGLWVVGLPAWSVCALYILLGLNIREVATLFVAYSRAPSAKSPTLQGCR